MGCGGLCTNHQPHLYKAMQLLSNQYSESNDGVLSSMWANRKELESFIDRNRH